MRSPVWIWTGGESATVVGKLSNGPRSARKTRFGPEGRKNLIFSAWVQPTLDHPKVAVVRLPAYVAGPAMSTSVYGIGKRKASEAFGLGTELPIAVCAEAPAGVTVVVTGEPATGKPPNDWTE